MKVPTLEYVGEICDQIECIHPGGVDLSMRIAEKTGLTTGMKVLDIACGRGTTACMYFEKFNCRLIGIDINPEMIERSKERARCLGIDPDNNPSISFIEGDARLLAFSDNSFDLVLIEGSLTLTGDPKKTLREMRRTAKPGGYVVFHDPIADDNVDQETSARLAEYMGVYKFRTRSQWIDLAEKVGIKEIYTEDWSGYENMLKMRINWDKKYLFTFSEELKILSRHVVPDFGVRGAFHLFLRDKALEKAYKNKTIGHFLLIGKK